MPYRVYALVQQVQPADSEPVLNGVLPHSCLKQLLPSNHSVLPPRQCRNRSI